jgi:capsular polysaccharide biosynthesis protein
MEFIRYWHILRRRWWLTVGLLIVVVIVSLIGYDWSPEEVFSATFRLNVGLDPVPPSDVEYEFNPRDVWQSSEYLMDDLAAAVRGAAFAARVSGRLSDSVPLAGAFGAATEHRVLTVSVRWHHPQQLAQIANAAVAVLQEEADDFVGSLGRSKPVLRLIDPPVVVPVGRSLTQKLDIPIRIGLSLIAGVAGSFLLDYVDQSVRDDGEIEAMGLRVLGHIPRRK